jgi:hypothetical protein
VLHHEVLVNVTDAGPLPNFYVYKKPWYRDGAMMALCLRATGNLDVIRDWIMGLTEPFDRNNAGENEADNLGQALFLISLVSDRNHPLVPKIQKELIRFQVQDQDSRYIKGRSDFAEHPVYQIVQAARLVLRLCPHHRAQYPYQARLYPDMHIGMNAYQIPDSSDEFNRQHDLAKLSHLPEKRNRWRDPW